MKIEKPSYYSHMVQKRMRNRLGKALWVLTLIGSVQTSLPSNVQAQVHSIADTVRFVRETPSVSYIALSPDGLKVAFIVRRQTVADGGLVSQELIVQRLSISNELSGLPEKIASISNKGEIAGDSISFQWCPSGDCIFYSVASRANAVAITPEIAKSGKLLRLDLASRISKRVEIADSEEVGNPRITSVPGGSKVSNSGRYLAFIAQTVPGKIESPDVGTRMTPATLRRGFFFTTPGKKSLFVLDTETGTVRQIPPNVIDIASFDWGPGDREIVFSGREGELTDARFCSESSLEDIYVATVDSGAVRKVVSQPGSDTHPILSPDGKWIAFRSTFGGTENDVTRLALIPAAGGKVEQLSGDDVTGLQRIAWAPDSRSIVFKAEFDLGWALKRIDVVTRKSSDVLNLGKTTTSSSYSVSRDGKRVAYVPESIVEPPEVVVRDVTSGRDLKTTDLSPNFALRGTLRLERVSWPSGDGKFQVQGFLIIPESVWPKGTSAPTKPLPTLTFLDGGPRMVPNLFGSHGLVTQMAMQGYPVFVPNPRGGRGGNGVEFYYGMVSGGPGYGDQPYIDIKSGVDTLVKRGIADPNRLGIYGHSAGGYLTEYAITQTDRFKAAIDLEGGNLSLLYNAQLFLSTGGAGCLMSSEFGVKNPFEPAELERLAKQSPILNLHKVKTPVLLLYGQANGPVDGRMIADGLRRLGVPSEFIVYDMGHYPARYSHVVDMNQRVRDWFNFWILDKPYPEKDLQAGYDAWKAMRAAEK